MGPTGPVTPEKPRFSLSSFEPAFPILQYLIMSLGNFLPCYCTCTPVFPLFPLSPLNPRGPISLQYSVGPYNQLAYIPIWSLFVVPSLRLKLAPWETCFKSAFLERVSFPERIRVCFEGNQTSAFVLVDAGDTKYKL